MLEKKKSFVFPGQGTQFLGMIDDLESFDVAKKLLKEANEILPFNLGEIMKSAPIEKLSKTEIAQPAILLHSHIIMEILKSKNSKEIFENVSCFAGHSLGEYSALLAMNVLKFSDAISLVHKRGMFMNEAVENLGGKEKFGMIAVIGLNKEKIKEILSEEITEKNFCEIANENSEDQIVLSGMKTGFEIFSEKAKRFGVKKIIKLNVSGPFHSKFMCEASERLKNELNFIEFSRPKTEIIMNVTGAPTLSENEIKNFLVQQIVSPVRWKETVDLMIERKITEVYEVGPGKILSSLFSRRTNEMNVKSSAEIKAENYLLNF